MATIRGGVALYAHPYGRKAPEVDVTTERFAALVHDAEELARRSPGGYRLRLVLLGGLGYVFVWGLLLLALAMIAVVLLSATGVGPVRLPVGLLDNLLIPIGAFVVIVGQALWVPLSPPQGQILEAGDFPELFATIERIRKEVGGPRIHQVVLDDQFNASISQVPRLGVFGWYRNYLTLGLPLVSTISPREFDAVVAHEYGHLAGSHGMVGTWIYRIRMTWGRLLGALQQKQGFATGFVRGFFNWYSPFFNAYSFALARANEYEADRTAAEVAGVDAMGGALVSISTLAPYIEQEFWPEVMGEAERVSAPTSTPFTALSQPGFGPSADRAETLLTGAMAATSNLGDTHPSLSERLGALGVEPSAPARPERTAAQAYFGSRLAALTSEMDATWRRHVTPYFEGRQQRVQWSRGRLAELEADTTDSATALKERAQIVDDLSGRDQALPLYQQLLELTPDDPLALCVVGFEELRGGDDAGIARVERGMSLDDRYIIQGCQAIRDHLAAVGRMDEAERYHARAAERYDMEEARAASRSRIPFEKAYEAHGLSPEAVASVRQAVQEHERVSAAYLVRKKDTEPPLYLVALVSRFQVTLGDKRRELAQEVAGAIGWAEDFQVVVMDGDNKPLRKFVRKVEGARLK